MALPASRDATGLPGVWWDRPTPGSPTASAAPPLVRQLQMPLAPVVAMAEYRVGDRLHRRLRGYKDAPVAEARHACAAELAGLVGRWMAANPTRLHRPVRVPWDVVATVPSSARPVGAPADALVVRVPDLARAAPTLLVRGPEPTDHLRAARRGFEVAPAVDRDAGSGSRRVLVFDDSITTGARAQSAAAALRMAGADVVGMRGRGPGGRRGRGPVGGRPAGCSARPGTCCCASSPSPSRAPPTTSCWPWPGRPRPRASTPSSGATTS